MRLLWAVYERADRCGCVICPLHALADGTYAPRVARHVPAIRPLPLSVHVSRAEAVHAVALVRYACAGTA